MDPRRSDGHGTNNPARSKDEHHAVCTGQHLSKARAKSFMNAWSECCKTEGCDYRILILGYDLVEKAIGAPHTEVLVVS
eukprot:1394425-Rhodomonas_salina.4